MFLVVRGFLLQLKVSLSYKTNIQSMYSLSSSLSCLCPPSIWHMAIRANLTSSLVLISCTPFRADTVDLVQLPEWIGELLDLSSSCGIDSPLDPAAWPIAPAAGPARSSLYPCTSGIVSLKLKDVAIIILCSWISICTYLAIYKIAAKINYLNFHSGVSSWRMLVREINRIFSEDRGNNFLFI